MPYDTTTGREHYKKVDPHYFEQVAKYPLLEPDKEFQLFTELDQNLLDWIAILLTHPASSFELVDSFDLTDEERLVLDIPIGRTEKDGKDFAALNPNEQRIVKKIRREYPCISRLKKIGQQPAILRIESLRQILNKIEKHTNDLVELIAASNLRLVIRIAQRHNFLKLPLSDLIQEGNIGLIKAIEKYELSRQTRFSTCAWWWVMQGITFYVRRQGGIVRKPENVIDDLLKITREFQNTSEFQRAEKIRTVAKKFQLPENRIKQLLSYIAPDISLNQPVSAFHENDFESELSDRSQQPDDIPITQSMLERHLHKLPARLQTIIKMRYGIDCHNEHSYREISEVIGLSCERTRQLEKEAIQKLQHSFRMH